MSTQPKTFPTPVMAGIYLGHSTEDADVDWEPLPLQPQLVGTRERPKTQVRAHRRRRVSHGHAIRKLLVTP